MEFINKFFSRKKAGFYLGLACAVLLFICAIVYLVGFNETGPLGDHASDWVVPLAMIGSLAFIGLSIFEVTSGLAAPVMGLCTLVAFTNFVTAGYLYFGEAFYGSFSFISLFNMNLAYLFCLLSFLFMIILISVCLYLKQETNSNNKEVSV